jgi:type II secretory pathway component PulK
MSRRGLKQRGMAVLGALIIIVIVVSLAASIGMRAMHSIAATARSFEARDADGLFEALEQDSRRVLRLDAHKERYDALNEPWASAKLQVSLAQGHGEARLRDAQGLFNLRDIAFDAEVVAQGGAQAQSEDTPPATNTESAATSENSALGGGVGGGLTKQAGAVGATRTASGSVAPPPSGAQQGGDSMGMVALAAVPGVASSGAAGAAGGQSGEGLVLSPQQIAVARFALLLRNLEIDDSVLPAILDWMDPDSDERFPNGAEDDYYSRLKPPYRAANRGFADVSELKLVRGIDDKVFAKLRPFVTILPDVTPINVNTAPVEVLMSLGPAMDRATANMIVEARKVRPFRSIAEFRALPMLLGRPLVSEGLTVGTDFFTLEMDVTCGQSVLAARALLARRDGDNVMVLSRDKGFFDD